MTRYRKLLMLGVGVAALNAAPAYAQDAGSVPATASEEEQAATPGGDQAAAAEEQERIVVTGSRIVRNGFDAPTPVSVVTAEEIEAAAPVTIADYVNQLPALAGSTNPRSHGNTASGGTAGANLLNLRNLGPNRTLTLLNGRRVTPSTLTGSVDVNTLPTGLVQRVDVVTGGASAAWGSDAVSGVVNFILDTKFTGLKGEVQAGLSELGDAQNVAGDLSGGISFAGGRGHAIFSANYSKSKIAFLGARDWYEGYKIFANPQFATGNGQPARLILPNSSLIITDFGLITTGPLRGTYFDVNGNVLATNYPFGPVISGIFQSGGPLSGDALASSLLVTPLEQGAVYGRASFELTDQIEAFGEVSYGDSRSSVLTGPLRRQVADTIRIDNFYLPASVRQRMAAAGVQTIPLFSNKLHLGIAEGINDRSVFRLLGGLEGRLSNGWAWEASAQYGLAKVRNAVVNNFRPARYLLAIDAVAHPVTGQPVCRSTLADPSNGCVPLSPFGGIAPTQAQQDYFIGTAIQNIRLRQDVFEANLQGTLFSLPAGDVSGAAGVEYREESAVADADPISAATQWFVGNYKPFDGAYDVKEAFAEILLPVIKDSSLGRSLELNGAVRATDYSTSGTVFTWKLGATYEPFQDLQFRFTRSRDIRAPNLNDLFLGGVTNTISISDPFRGGANAQFLQTTSGNPDLQPEVANSLTAGIIYRPAWLPGLSLSVDYYDIKIKEAIAVSSSQQIVNLCFAGSQDFCSLITRNPTDNTITGIRVVPFNALSEVASGVDVEASYRVDLGKGRLDFRTLVNYTDELEIRSPFGNTSRAGETGNNLGAAQGVARFRALSTVTYTDDDLTAQLKGRFIGAAKMESDYGPLDVNRNDVPAVLYLDAFLGLNVPFGGKEGEFYVAVDNLLDKDPPVVVSQDNVNAQGSGTNQAIYDTIGRAFRVGVRFKI